MRRREFIVGLGAVAWPLAVRAQSGMRRLALLMNYSEDDPEGQAWVVVFRETLEKLGWTLGRNLAIEFHWGMQDLERTRAAAGNLVRSVPDAILVFGGPNVAPLQEATSTIPIVFVLVSEPVALGFVASLARPSGNITGFTNLEATIGAKSLALLKEMAPRVTRFAVMFNPERSTIGAQLARSAQAAAQQLAAQLIEAQVRRPTDIEETLAALAREQHSGLIVAPDDFVSNHRKLVLDLATRYRLPAIYPYRFYADDGGLMSYGVDTRQQLRQAASYIDRILRGEKPSSLPVQQPVKFELVINLKTAKALGLTIPETLLATADEVIQ
jgi:putative ABC transport system substrate-binding protein